MSKNIPNNSVTISQSFVYYLIFTALTCGALVMVIEVLGSRVLGPFFGVSLFVWTSLITVTLVALAAGYAAGGVLSDKRGSPDYLYGIILASGFFALLMPLIKGSVLKTCLPLGLRAGALAGALLLFGPSLFLLGCVSPYLVKIAAKEMKNIGRTVGVFYAVSTVGGVLGTVVTGFILIAHLGVNRIFAVIGLMLIFLALVYFLFFRRRWRPLLFLLVVPVFLLQAAPTVSKVMADGTRVTKVFDKDGFYGTVKVVDYSFGTAHTRELIIDGFVQGGVDVNSGMSVYEYSYFMQFLPYGLNPSGKNCLVIGLGAGLVPMWYESRGIKTDVVDIDPNIPDIAARYFGFHVTGDVFISDARYYLGNTDRKYDYIVLDVFNGDTTPGHVLSVEAMRLLSGRLTPKGILVINLAGSLTRETFMTASVVRTVKSVFKTVAVHPVFSPEEGEGWGNMAVVAYNYPFAPFNPEAGRPFPVHSLAAEGVRRFLGTAFSFSNDVDAVILSDDYNPIDVYDAWLKENIRKNILQNTDWDILI